MNVSIVNEEITFTNPINSAINTDRSIYSNSTKLTPNNLNENVNGGPVKVIAYAASSVCIKVSFLVGVIATILLPTSNL